MKLLSRLLFNGALPYNDVESCLTTMSKIQNQMSYLPLLPRIKNSENLLTRTFGDVPIIRIVGTKLAFQNQESDEFQSYIKQMSNVYRNSESNLDDYAIKSNFMSEYLKSVKDYQIIHPCIKLIGPFSALNALQTDTSATPLITNKKTRNIILRLITLKALWFITQVNKVNPTATPIIIFEEPALNKVGYLRRIYSEVQDQIIIDMFDQLAKKIRSYGAGTAIQSLKKCDWRIPMRAKVDIISLNSYYNPWNLCIFPQDVIEYITHGGKINWASIPCHSDRTVEFTKEENLYVAIRSMFEGLISVGVPEDLIYRSATISPLDDMDELSILYAEKIMMITKRVAERLFN